MEKYEQKYDLFVYGTLCVPAVLIRVLGRPSDHLTFRDALLIGYTRHCVKGEDYPAIVNTGDTTKIIPPDSALSAEEYNTRGTLVSGLSYHDIEALDIFEGSEYARRRIVVQTIGPATSAHGLPSTLRDRGSGPPDMDESKKAVKSSDTQEDEGSGEKECWAYTWSAPLNRLEPRIWKFEEFMRDKAKYWVSADTREYDEVDQHRATGIAEGQE